MIEIPRKGAGMRDAPFPFPSPSLLTLLTLLTPRRLWEGGGVAGGVERVACPHAAPARGRQIVGKSRAASNELPVLLLTSPPPAAVGGRGGSPCAEDRKAAGQGRWNRCRIHGCSGRMRRRGRRGRAARPPPTPRGRRPGAAGAGCPASPHPPRAPPRPRKGGRSHFEQVHPVHCRQHAPDAVLSKAFLDRSARSIKRMLSNLADRRACPTGSCRTCKKARRSA